MSKFSKYEDFRLECGTGWNDLIFKTLDKLPNGVKIYLVKEKFGRLSFHLTPESIFTPEVDKILFDAEKESLNICELCGKSNGNFCPGGAKITTEYYIDGSWLRTLCKECRDKENAVRIPKQQIDRQIIDSYKKTITKNARKI